MIWRVIEPIPEGATEETIRFLSENAYINSIAAVLPAGMVGLMIAAMFSATAVIQLFSGKTPAPSYARLELLASEYADQQREAPVLPSRLPAIIVGWALVACAGLMGLLFVINQDKQESFVIGVFTIVVTVLGIVILGLSQRLAGSVKDCPDVNDGKK